MPLTEFNGWVAYYSLKNEKHTATDQNIAHLACLITNYLCKKKYKLRQFLPTIKKQNSETFDKKQGENFFKSLVGIVKKAKR